MAITQVITAMSSASRLRAATLEGKQIEGQRLAKDWDLQAHQWAEVHTNRVRCHPPSAPPPATAAIIDRDAEGDEVSTGPTGRFTGFPTMKTRIAS